MVLTQLTISSTCKHPYLFVIEKSPSSECIHRILSAPFFLFGGKRQNLHCCFLWEGALVVHPSLSPESSCCPISNEFHCVLLKCWPNFHNFLPQHQQTTADRLRTLGEKFPFSLFPP
ncbi:uncharacterized protein LOC110268563 isoform X2 [Arachis ipaensis]|uniref:uncharacterized protein LOC110268563 isoform X2 n=1 Tax=Arachis ipaensis TaxID=130454 RepID=UPI000A2B2E9E|nr:uncharacterized protein LOC110268563 isoform X2 [Arachis ipaensis]